MVPRLYKISNLSKLQFATAAIALLGVYLAVAFTNAMGQSAFDRGKKMYHQRAANADSFKADPTNINRAIDLFETALEQNIKSEESAIYLLRSYYFKGMFTGLNNDQQKDIYDKGRNLGEKMMDRYPESVPIKFWYAANIGRWADVHGFLKAATNGISKKLRRVCEKIIEQDPEYQGGGGYRILAQVHFHSPNIPIVMGWPSKEQALKLIQKALEIAPDHPTNQMLYANILLEFDRYQEAKEQFEKISQMAIRDSHVIEDRYIKYRSQKLLEEHFH
ncbi:tetratricopeptide repeat protein [Fodinibius sp. SL11]|uniref:tetratricopeptide repeat protein n=1 Tax=Fodinibius sp. SL11 TaxID=3425690 RepID=UPI003F88061C